MTNSGDGSNCFQYSFDAERADVIAHLPRVRDERLLPLGVRLALRRAPGTPSIGTFASMTIVALPGSLTIRSGVCRAPISVVDRRLFDEVALVRQAGQFDDAPELEFAPAAAHVRATAASG